MTNLPSRPSHPSSEPESEGEAPQDQQTPERASRRGSTAKILREDQCLAGISQLPGLVGMNYLKPAQANAMRGAFHDLLAHHRASRERPAGGSVNADFVAAARENPSLLNLLEPLLTDEQFEAILNEINRDPNG